VGLTGTGIVQVNMRPNLSDEIVEDVDNYVGQISGVDADSVGFEQKLRIILSHVAEIDEENMDSVISGYTNSLGKKYR
jgi:hypothetical protein